MAFIGVIRPLVKGNSTEKPNRVPALALALGFVLTSVPVYWAVWLAGERVFGQLRETTTVWFVAAGALLALLLTDLGVAGLRTPFWRRQAPQRFMYRFRPTTAAFLWGADAGLVFTTFRFTALTWAGLALTFLGVVPPWAGAIYAAGFVLPELASQILVPRRVMNGVDTDPQWLLDLLLRIRPRMRRAAMLVLGIGAVLSAAIPLTLGG